MTQATAPAPAAAPARPAPSAGPTAQLFLISVLGLFLELLLIRWVSTEIRIFAYLQNTVLVVCFLGLGMGCWDSRRKPFALRDVLLPLAHPGGAARPFRPTRVWLGQDHRPVQRVQRPAGVGWAGQPPGGTRSPAGRRAWSSRWSSWSCSGTRSSPSAGCSGGCSTRPPAHGAGVLGERGRQPGRDLAVRRACSAARPAAGRVVRRCSPPLAAGVRRHRRPAEVDRRRPARWRSSAVSGLAGLGAGRPRSPAGPRTRSSSPTRCQTRRGGGPDWPTRGSLVGERSRPPGHRQVRAST